MGRQRSVRLWLAEQAGYARQAEPCTAGRAGMAGTAGRAGRQDGRQCSESRHESVRRDSY